MTHQCEWCEAELDPKEIAMLCDRCHAEHIKQLEADARKRDAYWRHIDQKIDVARGK